MDIINDSFNKNDIKILIGGGFHCLQENTEFSQEEISDMIIKLYNHYITMGDNDSVRFRIS